ncbi:hypothetical protein WNZ15_10800 [Roseibium sp. AS2]|uniref:hypothetical protein n=1 Tax=Roseibium sp. AS2 TaxID=3135781 RepID=UPI00316F3853
MLTDEDLGFREGTDPPAESPGQDRMNQILITAAPVTDQFGRRLRSIVEEARPDVFPAGVSVRFIYDHDAGFQIRSALSKAGSGRINCKKSGVPEIQVSTL